jgi:hypothetical protein
VTNLDSTTTLAIGKTFKLFSAARLTNEFASVILPPLRTGLKWDTSQLATDGTLRVSAVPPQILPLTSANGSIMIRFQTAQGLYYALESATTLEAGAAWTFGAARYGTGGPTTFIIPVESTATQRFFRVRVN